MGSVVFCPISTEGGHRAGGAMTLMRVIVAATAWAAHRSFR